MHTSLRVVVQDGTLQILQRSNRLKFLSGVDYEQGALVIPVEDRHSFGDRQLARGDRNVRRHRLCNRNRPHQVRVTSGLEIDTTSAKLEGVALELRRSHRVGEHRLGADRPPV